MKQQIVLIHGGNTFATYGAYLAFLRTCELDFERSRKNMHGWKENLPETLGESFEVIAPKMPNNTNAKYAEWGIWFEKFIPYLDQELILIGHSLGGIFLAKYLSENEMSNTVRATFLIAAPHDDVDITDSLADFILPDNLLKFSTQMEKIFIYHSKDDPVVPFVDAEKYQNDLPNATMRIFTDRGHFNQETIPEERSSFILKPWVNANGFKINASLREQTRMEYCSRMNISLKG